MAEREDVMQDSDGTKVRVLIADDMSAFRRLLQMLLARDDRYQVVATAVDGKDAVENAARHKPDVVLLDLSMPTMDGLEALPELRKVSPSATIIVLSAFQSRRMETPALEGGAAAYLEKGLPPDQMLAAIERLLRAQRPDLPGFADHTRRRRRGDPMRPEALDDQPPSTDTGTGPAAASACSATDRAGPVIDLDRLGNAFSRSIVAAAHCRISPRTRAA